MSAPASPVVLCPSCGQPIPDNRLSCPNCLADKSYQAILAFQKQFLPRILSGEFTVGITKPADAKRWHLTLANYAQQAWCGEHCSPNWKHRERLNWPKLDESRPLCEYCRRAFEEMAKQSSVGQRGRE